MTIKLLQFFRGDKMEIEEWEDYKKVITTTIDRIISGNEKQKQEQKKHLKIVLNKLLKRLE
jgi:hypothetical protein